MFEFEDSSINQLVQRFEEMLASHSVLFFDVDDLESLADHYFENGFFNKAMKAIDLGSDQHPTSASFPIKRAQYFLATNKLDKAEEELERAESLDPNNFDLLVARGTFFSKEGQHRQAIVTFKEAIEAHQDPVEIYPLVAYEHQQLGEYKEAIKWLKLTLETFPDDELALYNLSLCYDFLEANEKAIGYFKKYLDTNPYSETAWYQLGLIYNKLDKPKLALEAFDFALIIDEYFTAAYFEKAKLHEKLGQYEQATETYLRSFEYDEPSGYSYYRLGNCYRQMGEMRKAQKFFRLAISEDPELDEAYLELSLINLAHGKIFESIHNIRKAISLDEENTDYLVVAADVYKQVGLYLEATQCYEKILDQGYKDPELYIDYAELLLDMDEVEQALGLLKEAVSLHGDSEELLCVYAGYLLAVGRDNEAFDQLAAAKVHSPKVKDIFFEYFPHYADEENIASFLD